MFPQGFCGRMCGLAGGASGDSSSSSNSNGTNNSNTSNCSFNSPHNVGNGRPHTLITATTTTTTTTPPSASSSTPPSSSTPSHIPVTLTSTITTSTLTSTSASAKITTTLRSVDAESGMVVPTGSSIELENSPRVQGEEVRGVETTQKVVQRRVRNNSDSNYDSNYDSTSDTPTTACSLPARTHHWQNLVSSQVKALSFLTYLFRGFSKDFANYRGAEGIPSAVVRLLRAVVVAEEEEEEEVSERNIYFHIYTPLVN